MKKLYQSKVVIVTGASSGIGRAMCLYLVKSGARVVGVARRSEKLEQLQKSATKYPGELHTLTIDISKHSDIDKLAEYVSKEFGLVDMLVNNAAAGHFNSFAQTSTTQIEKIIQTNVVGTMLTTKQLLPYLRKSAHGQIVFVTSLAGKIGFENLATYSASKFALEGLADALRQELSHTNISVTVLRPGVTDTEFFTTAKMTDFYNEAKDRKQLISAESVAIQSLTKLRGSPREIVVGPDKRFLRILPFVPHRYRFKVLAMLSK